MIKLIKIKLTPNLVPSKTQLTSPTQHSPCQSNLYRTEHNITYTYIPHSFLALQFHARPPIEGLHVTSQLGYWGIPRHTGLQVGM